MTKISSSQLLVLTTLAVARSVSAAKNQQHADDEFFSKAFGMVQVQSNHAASKWRDFLSTGPLPEAVEELIEDEQDNLVNNHDAKDRELWHDPWSSPPKRGWFSIDTDGNRALEVKNKNSGEECFSVGEGIGKDAWKFGITQGHVSDSNSTNGNTTDVDTYLQLFEEWHPYMPVYKYFRGAKKLCIGEKSSENIAYLYIITDAGCYYLVGKPDSGRRDHLPKLQILNQDDRRQRRLRKKQTTAAGEGRELWSASDYSDKYVVVRFRDGPGITNTFWQIWQNGFAKTTPNARWFFVPTGGDHTPENPIEPGPGPGPGPGPDPDNDDATRCTDTGGSVEYTMCECVTKDFFNTCGTCGAVEGTACDTGCVSGPKRLNCYCNCPANMCFNEIDGCVSCIPDPVPGSS